MWFFAGTLIWYHTHTHTHKDTQHTQTNTLTHPYKYISKPSVMCSQQLSVLHWIIQWYQKFTFQCLFFLKITQVIYLYIRSNKTKLFLWNTNNTDKNGVNKQNTHTPNTLRKITLERDGEWGSNYEPGCLWIFVFNSAKEASNDVNTFLNLRFITKQKPALFWENITC